VKPVGFVNMICSSICALFN